MAQSVFSIRMDDKVKDKFSKLCDDFGLSMSSCINVFAKTVIREGKIPFEVISTENYNKAKGMHLIDELHNDYVKKGGKDLSLSEINAIIYGKA